MDSNKVDYNISMTAENQFTEKLEKKKCADKARTQTKSYLDEQDGCINKRSVKGIAQVNRKIKDTLRLFNKNVYNLVIYFYLSSIFDEESL